MQNWAVERSFPFYIPGSHICFIILKIQFAALCRNQRSADLIMITITIINFREWYLQRRNVRRRLTCTDNSFSWLTSPNRRHLALRLLYKASPCFPATAMSTPSGERAAWVRGQFAARYEEGGFKCWIVSSEPRFGSPSIGSSTCFSDICKSLSSACDAPVLSEYGCQA